MSAILFILYCLGAWVVGSIPLALVIGRMIANAEREHEAHVERAARQHDEAMVRAAREWLA